MSKVIIMGMEFDEGSVPDFGSIYPLELSSNHINCYGLLSEDLSLLYNITNAAYGSLAVCDDTGNPYRLTKNGWMHWGVGTIVPINGEEDDGEEPESGQYGEQNLTEHVNVLNNTTFLSYEPNVGYEEEHYLTPADGIDDIEQGNDGEYEQTENVEETEDPDAAPQDLPRNTLLEKVDFPATSSNTGYIEEPEIIVDVNDGAEYPIDTASDFEQTSDDETESEEETISDNKPNVTDISEETTEPTEEFQDNKEPEINEISEQSEEQPVIIDSDDIAEATKEQLAEKDTVQSEEQQEETELVQEEPEVIDYSEPTKTEEQVIISDNTQPENQPESSYQEEDLAEKAAEDTDQSEEQEPEVVVDSESAAFEDQESGLDNAQQIETKPEATSEEVFEDEKQDNSAATDETETEQIV